MAHLAASDPGDTGSNPTIGKKSLFVKRLGSVRCKHIVRWQHLSQIKVMLLWLDENVFSLIKTQQATYRTSAAAYKLMEPHCGALIPFQSLARISSYFKM